MPSSIYFVLEKVEKDGKEGTQIHVFTSISEALGFYNGKKTEGKECDIFAVTDVIKLL